MNFGQPYPTIRQSDLGNPFSLTPTTTAVELSKTIAVANPLTSSDRFNRGYLADYFKVHREELTRDSSEPHNAALERLAHATTNKGYSWRVRSKRLFDATWIECAMQISFRHNARRMAHYSISFSQN
jgi:hypothetical protein